MNEPKDKNGLTEQEYLAAYRPGDYERPSVAVDMVIFTVGEKEETNYRKLPEKELRLLLIRRGGHPFLGCWALPGGFSEPEETTEQAAVRELKEETGIDNLYLEQLYTFSEPHRDPRTWVMSCSYLALADSECLQLTPGDDAREAEWFTVRLQTTSDQVEGSEDNCRREIRYQLELVSGEVTLSGIVHHTITRSKAGLHHEYEIVENNGIAFDHIRIITYALERLRGKIEYTDIALNLMPDYFTLSELQQVYEIILGKPLVKAQFRRKYGALLAEPSDRLTSDAGHRPSRLYRRKWII